MFNFPRWAIIPKVRAFDVSMDYAKGLQMVHQTEVEIRISQLNWFVNQTFAKSINRSCHLQNATFQVKLYSGLQVDLLSYCCGRVTKSCSYEVRYSKGRTCFWFEHCKNIAKGSRPILKDLGAFFSLWSNIHDKKEMNEWTNQAIHKVLHFIWFYFMWNW